VSPIHRENRHRYPENWPDIRDRILLRARHRCEECGVRDRVWGWRDGEGVFHNVSRRPLIDAGFLRPPFDIASRKGTLHVIEIVLTVSHTDHVPEHCTDDNLRALCQQCHLRHDLRHHNHTRRFGLEVGQMELEVDP
jgi:5-methylcytosine-specific restriction endonuclease McrA